MTFRLFLLFALVCCSVGIVSPAFAEEKLTYGHATVITPNGTRIDVELADTEAKRQRGLGFRSELPALQGMLFIFDKRDRHSFWMKNTLIALDIIWLDNHRIVHIEHSVPATPSDPNPPSLIPQKKANFVLELGSGEAKKLGLTLGSKLKYQF